ncbi:MAG: hypothetical protein U0414_41530 [Polyangiaceae bacterium]
MRLSYAILAASILGLAGCDAEDPEVADEQDLSATIGAFKVSLNVLAPKDGVARVHGVVNQGIERAFAFIPDDEVGSTDDAPKSFTSKFGPSETGLFLGGRPAFFAITTTAGEHFVARGDLGVKAHVASSSAGLKVSLHAQSVVVGGAAFQRFKGTYTEALTAASATIAGAANAGVTSAKTWRIDVPIQPLGGIIAKKTPVEMTVTTASGATVKGTLTIELETRAIDITDGDAYETWPAPACDATVLACLQQPANVTDASACGDAFHVLPCWKTAHP